MELTKRNCIFFIGVMSILGFSQQLPAQSKELLEAQLDSLIEKGRELEVDEPEIALDLYKSSLSLAKANDLHIYRIDALKELGYFYRYQNPDSSLYYFEEALSVALRYGKPGDIMRVYGATGRLYSDQGNHVAAIQEFEKAVHQAEVVGDPEMLAFYYLDIGSSYSQIAAYDQARTYTMKALDQATLVNDKEMIMSIYGNLGILFNQHDKYEEALAYQQKALQVWPEAPELQVAYAKINLALTHKKLGQFSQAMVLLNEGLDLLKNSNDAYGSIACHHNMGSVFFAMGDYAKAKEQLQVSDSLMKYHNLQFPAVQNELLMAQIAFAEMQYAYALQKANSCIRYCREFGVLETLFEALELKSEILEKQGKPVDALLTFRKAGEMKDSIRTLANEKSLNELHARFDLSEKERLIQLLNQEKALEALKSADQQRQNLVLVIILSMLSLITGLIAYGYRKNLRLHKRLKESHRVISQQAKQLQQSSEEKTTFFSNISHELRTPLTLVNGVLHSDHLDEENLQMARRSTRQLEHMIDELLDLARMEMTPVEIDLLPQAVSPLLKRIVYSFESLFVEHEIRFEVRLELTDTIVADLDITRFERVINNLLVNALKFTPKGGCVTFLAEVEQELLQIHVMDTGPGIPNDELSYIFERFYQAQNQAHTSQFGTGLGLAIARDLTHKMNGKLQVCNRAEGGACFTLTMPIYEKELEVQEVSDSRLVSLEAIGKKRILIVEDHPDMQQYLQKILGAHFKTTVVSGGVEALEVIDKQKPDLIITDVMMPEMDGFDLIKQLKENEGLYQLPVVVLTAKGSKEDKLKFLQLGVDDYLTKPFHPEELCTRVYNLFENQRARARWESKVDESENEESSPPEAPDLIERISEYVVASMGGHDPSVGDIAHHLAMSERQLYRKLGELTGLSPANLVREIKLTHAMKLLQRGEYQKVEAVARYVGFNNTSYFSRLFFKRFGKRPMDVIT
ncbi:response regulator [Marinoscillum furvescens]|nr:response regulator [Marinoscillum furvescens]